MLQPIQRFQAVSQVLKTRSVVPVVSDPVTGLQTPDRVSFQMNLPSLNDLQRWVLDALVQIIYQTETGKKLSNLDIRPDAFQGYRISGYYKTFWGHSPFEMGIHLSASPQALFIKVDNAYATQLHLPYKWAAAYKIKDSLSQRIPGVYRNTWTQVGISIQALPTELQWTIHYMRRLGLIPTAM